MRSSLITGAAVAASLGLAAGGVAYAAMYPTSQIFGPVLIAGGNPREIALTYDDGPNPALTPRLLDLLAATGVKATFFMIGSFAREHGRLARAVAEAGHLVGNHTMSHPRLTWQSSSRIRQELGDTQHLLEDTLGAPVRYFRPPFGARRPYVMRVARELGLSTVMWNITGRDWEPIGAHSIADRVDSGIARNTSAVRGSNVLLHDGSHRADGANRDATLEATAHILERHRNSRFVTVDAWHV